MISMKEVIMEELSQVCDNVTDSYPKDDATYPLLLCLENDNHVKVTFDGKESISYLKYKIDILDLKDTTELTFEVNKIMAKLGFKRIKCKDILETDRKRKSIYYDALLDIENNYIYENQENGEEK